MRALVYTGTMQSEVQQIELESLQAGQVCIDVHLCGICGSDMHAWHGHDERRVPPLVLGHEAVGVAQSGVHAGKRVVINPLMSCMTCAYCLRGDEHLCPSRELLGMRVSGAFAEQVIITERNLTAVSDSLSDEDAALAEPLACAVNAVQLAIDRCEDRDANAVVFGGGAIGLLSAMVFADKGYRNIFIAETNALRREMIEKLGNFRCYDPISSQPDCRDVDIILDAVGSGRTRAAASALVRPGGVISHIGLQDSEPGLDTRRLTLQQIHFAGSYCYRKTDFAEAVRLLETGAVTSDGWSDVRSLADGVQAFNDIHNGNAPPKIILDVRR